MKKFKSFKEESKNNWGIHLAEGEHVPNDRIQLGAILRIADATEAMAKNYIQLQNDYEEMKKSRDNYRNAYENQKKSISVYKGQITKLKNKYG